MSKSCTRVKNILMNHSFLFNSLRFAAISAQDFKKLPIEQGRYPIRTQPVLDISRTSRRHHFTLPDHFSLTMKAIAVLLLSLASVTVASRLSYNPGRGHIGGVHPGLSGPSLHQPLVHQPLVHPGLGGHATGSAGGTVQQGQQTGLFGSSKVQSLSAHAQVRYRSQTVLICGYMDKCSDLKLM